MTNEYIRGIVTVVGATDHDHRIGSYEKVRRLGKKMYVLTYSKFLEEWTLTTKENYQRRVQNAREIRRFSKRDGFQCTTDVIHYIMKHFDINLDQITCVNC